MPYEPVITPEALAAALGYVSLDFECKHRSGLPAPNMRLIGAARSDGLDARGAVREWSLDAIRAWNPVIADKLIEIIGESQRRARSGWIV